MRVGSTPPQDLIHCLEPGADCPTPADRLSGREGHAHQPRSDLSGSLHPWQRGTNENTNELLRQYFPKGTDMSVHSAEELAAVAIALNARPRKTLGWRTPAEALDQFLRSSHIGRVATTT